MMLDWIATLGDYRGRLFRWGDLQYLLTQSYRLPGCDEADVRLALGREPAEPVAISAAYEAG